MDQSAPPQRSSRPAAILAVLVLAASAVGVIVYQLMPKEKSTADRAGFDISQIQEGPQAAATIPQSPSSQSSLGMIKKGAMGPMRFGAGAVQAGAGRKALDFTAIARASEAKVQALAGRYTRRYPLIAQYGQDWMSYPDLKELNDGYMRDHDPVRFLHGVARSKNFGKLAGKYAAASPIQNFVKDAMKDAGADATSAAMSLIKDDSLVKSLISNTASSLGLPPALTAGLFSSGQVDEKQIMGQIMQNPDLQKSLQNPNSGK